MLKLILLAALAQEATIKPSLTVDEQLRIARLQLRWSFAANTVLALREQRMVKLADLREAEAQRDEAFAEYKKAEAEVLASKSLKQCAINLQQEIVCPEVKK